MRRIFLAALLCLFCHVASADMFGASLIVGSSVAKPPVPLTISCAGTGTISSTISCTGTYTSTAPATTGWTYAWNTTCSGSGSVTSVASVSGGSITGIVVPTPSSACAGTATLTTNIPTSAPSGNVTILGSGISLVAHGHIAGAVNGGMSPPIDAHLADFEVVMVSRYASSGNAVTVVDSSLNTWTPLTFSGAGTPESSCQFFYSVNPTVTSSQTFSATGTGLFLSAQIMAFNTVNTSTPFDHQSVFSAHLAATIQPGSITPSQANSLILTMVSFGLGGSSATVNSGFTKPEADIPYGTSVNEGMAAGYLVQGAAAAINPTWTPNATVDLSSCVADFKP